MTIQNYVPNVGDVLQVTYKYDAQYTGIHIFQELVGIIDRINGQYVKLIVITASFEVSGRTFTLKMNRDMDRHFEGRRHQSRTIEVIHTN